MNSEAEKLHLEHEAARVFMRHYEQRTGKTMRHIWHNKPQKPDASCFLEGERLDLEIAHLYGSEKEAMQLLGRSLTDHTRQELDFLESEPVHDRLICALNRILESKSHKSYHSRRVWLVVRNVHPAWTTADIHRLQTLIQVPQGHPFEQIWIVGDMLGHSGIFQLFPHPPSP
ncbi:MAG: hypothetical protein IPM37_15845 [Hahellaceae bacterium]|nr:hypothetical protein [Hahellaceae bacterium]